MDAPDPHEPAEPDAAPADAGRPAARPTDVEQPDGADADRPDDTEALVRLVAQVRSAPRRVDPEDWSRSGGDDDERYQRERPPHWE